MNEPLFSPKIYIYIEDAQMVVLESIIS